MAVSRAHPAARLPTTAFATDQCRVPPPTPTRLSSTGNMEATTMGHISEFVSGVIRSRPHRGLSCVRSRLTRLWGCICRETAKDNPLSTANEVCVGSRLHLSHQSITTGSEVCVGSRQLPAAMAPKHGGPSRPSGFPPALDAILVLTNAEVGNQTLQLNTGVDM